MRAVVERVARASNSMWGNPITRLITNQGTYLTETDSHAGLVGLGLESGDVVELSITEGRVDRIDVVTSQEITEETREH